MWQSFWCDFSWPGVTKISIKQLNKQLLEKVVLLSNLHFLKVMTRYLKCVRNMNCFLAFWFVGTIIPIKLITLNKCSTALGNVIILYSNNSGSNIWKSCGQFFPVFFSCFPYPYLGMVCNSRKCRSIEHRKRDEIAFLPSNFNFGRLLIAKILLSAFLVGNWY